VRFGQEQIDRRSVERSACVRSRHSDSRAQLLGAHSWHKFELCCDQLVQFGMMPLSLPQKIAAQRQDHRYPHRPRLRRLQQQLNEPTALRRVLAQGVNLLALIDEDDQRRRSDVRQIRSKASQTFPPHLVVSQQIFDRDLPLGRQHRAIRRQ